MPAGASDELTPRAAAPREAGLPRDGEGAHLPPTARRPRNVPATPLRTLPHAFVLVVVLTGLWAWWAWKQGGYFGMVYLPGIILLCAAAVLLALTAPWRGSLRSSPPAVLAVAGLAGLATWTLASAIWSPAPDIAIGDAQRVFGYALAFGVGIWLANLAGRRVELAYVPLALAGTGVAVATAITLLNGHDIVAYLDTDGTLQFPLGYRNANAAFFLIAMWPALGLATQRGVDWRLRGIALGGATLCLEIGLLSQSRGSAIAAVGAVIVYLFAAKRRAQAFGWLVLAIAPATIIVPSLTHLFHDAGHPAALLPDLRSAARSAFIGAGIALVAGSVAARLGQGIEAPRVGHRLDQSVLVGLFIVPLAGLATFVILVGSPFTWVGQRINEFNVGHTTGFSHQATRFGFNAATGRSDLWRIALRDANAHPLLGDGAGGYRYSYLLHRRRPVTVRDAHSVELETLSELGAPGLALLVVGVAGAAVAVWRARRVGPAAASLAAIGLGAGTYWLVHTSIDWFWPYPAVTAPALCLAGAACEPALRGRIRAAAAPAFGRIALLAACTLLALSVVPPYLADRYLALALAEWHRDLPQAKSDLADSRRWNQLSEDPLLAEGAIDKAAGEKRPAIVAFKRAAAKRPEDWTPHYYLATLYATGNPRRARAELAEARRLNPLEPVLQTLRHRLG